MCQRLSSTTTRIKTNAPADHHPLRDRGQRLSSTTTRIKTRWSRCHSFWAARQRLSSTTTRIKTQIKTSRDSLFQVRDYLPLQQGLRPVIILGFATQCAGQRLSSTTTRIKTPASRTDTTSAPARCQRLSSTTTRIKTP